MRKELSEAMKIIAEKEANDSPVYTFIRDLQPPLLAKAEALAAVHAALPIESQPEIESAPVSADNPTISILMEQAEEALEKNNFIVARALLADLHEKMPNEVHIVQKLALATYKSKLPTEMQSLEDARALLAGLNPEECTDTETLGLLQAVHKRMWNLGKNRANLDRAIWASEKGFYLKNDYYNGINLAYLYNVRAAVSGAADAIADFVLAQRTRRRVIGICEALLAQAKTEAAGKWFNRDAAYWVLATLAEASVGLGDETKAQQYLDEALALQPPPAQWMIDSTQDQLKNLRNLLSDSPLKNLG
jgi:hypothetical protein